MSHKPAPLRSDIAWSTRDHITVRGRDLPNQILGHMNLGDFAYLQLSGREATPQQSAMFITLVEQGPTPSAICRAPEPLQAALAAGLCGLGSVFVGHRRRPGTDRAGAGRRPQTRWPHPAGARSSNPQAGRSARTAAVRDRRQQRHGRAVCAPDPGNRRAGGAGTLTGVAGERHRGDRRDPLRVWLCVGRSGNRAISSASGMSGCR